jgi:hypothetical protein
MLFLIVGGVAACLLGCSLMNEHNVRVDHICTFGSPRFTNEYGSKILSQQLPLTLVEHALDPIVGISFPTLSHPFGNEKYAELNPRTLMVLEPVGINTQIRRLIQESHASNREHSAGTTRMNDYRAGSVKVDNQDDLKSYKALLFHGLKCESKTASRRNNTSLMKLECHFMKSYVNALQSLIEIEQPDITVNLV